MTQASLFDSECEASGSELSSGPVECLRVTFPNDEERRKYFLSILREKLKDPEFRKIEGFPIGSDEDILALSDPPYYTACPNPFIEDFIRHYGKPYDPSARYNKEPFAADVSEGRYAPESLAHSYHTKVPARAIARYILHYTEPGDVVLDGFCGTGMTAVAAQLCSGETSQAKDEIQRDVPNAVWGLRYAIVTDLAPAATFIAANYLHTPQVNDLESRCDDAIQSVHQATDWMFTTTITLSNGEKVEARVDHMVWSDVFACDNCGSELVLWHLAIGENGDIDKSNLHCTGCKKKLRSLDLIRVQSTTFDKFLGKPVVRPKAVPVQISYSHKGIRGAKPAIDGDLALLQRIQESLVPHEIPVLRMLFRDGVWGDMYRSGYHAGTSHFHHFFTLRNLYGLAALRKAVLQPRVVWGSSMLLTATAQKLSRMMRYMSDGIGRIQNGVLYFPSLFKESNPVHLLDIAKAQLLRLRREVRLNPKDALVSTSSGADIRGLPDNSIDYIFVDPPFGGNIMYSEVNFLWEAWLGVFTNAGPEAIVNKTQGKDFATYTQLMLRCFAEFHRVLKPGRWMTVEFHNSQNSVWNAIQQAIMEAGFIIADVRVLDKKQGSFKQVTTAGAVKQDLVISTYKPNGGLEDRFKLTAGTEEGVWDFIRTHLKQLPVFVSKDGQAEVIAERQNYLLFDRMVAFHVQRGVTVPLSAAEFYAGLEQRFPTRDGMYFLPEQVAEYDKKRMTVREVLQLQLFVSDEASAIQWLKQQLTRKPQTFQELHPQFLKEIGGWQKHERALELSELLEQNFLRYDGKGEVPSQIHSYLSTNFKDLRNLPKDDPPLRVKAKDRWYVPDPNKAGDLEKLRERALLREFEEYLESKQKRLKVFRLEAVRAGFKKAWQERDYATIIAVARKIPENVLQEDSKLLMWYDQALTRTGEH
jgi:DNA modification methylase